VQASRRIDAPARSGLVVIFGDLSRLILEPGAKAQIDSYTYDRRTRTGQLDLRMLSGGFSFESGKMPSESRRLMTPFGQVDFHGTCVYGSATSIVVQRCADMVTVSLADGRSVKIDEGQGFTTFPSFTFCVDAGCNPYLTEIRAAVVRLAEAEQARAVEPGNGPQQTNQQFGPVLQLLN
jgi:hypothetical protein